MKLLTKAELDQITTEDLKNLISTEMIYKYTSLSIGVDDVLVKGTLKFSDPTEYNDPFDCHEYLLKVDMSKANVEKFVETQYSNYSRSFKRELVRRYNKNDIYTGLKAERKRFKITCFSRDHKSILLWSHYAEMHRGICIGFQFPPIYHDKFILTPVSYIETIPLMDRMVDAYKMIRYWLSMKSDCWEYEQEIRAITKSKNNSSFEYVQYERNCIKEIIFGCKVSQDEINNSKRTLIHNEFILKDIQLKRMVIDEDTFKLKEIIIPT